MSKIRNMLLLGFILSIMAACTVVRTGIAVEMNDGTKPLLGEAKASLIEGEFYVTNLDGLKCSGTYNPYDMSTVLKVGLLCSDGRNGSVMVTRSGPNLTNGSGIGRLNDGTKFRVLLGEMVNYRNAQGIWEKQGNKEF